MAKNTQPIAKRCMALGISPAVMGYAKKNTTRNSNGNMRKKQSEYATQLKEKQKVKFIYGVLEKQFHNAYLKAEAMPGKTGENLLQLMERRLDNVVFRLGFAQTRRDARQLVSHAHFTVNGKKVNIPSYLIKAGDVIEVRESSRSSAKFAKLTGPEAPVVALPSWLDREAGTPENISSNNNAEMISFFMSGLLCLTENAPCLGQGQNVYVVDTFYLTPLKLVIQPAPVTAQ